MGESAHKQAAERSKGANSRIDLINYVATQLVMAESAVTWAMRHRGWLRESYGRREARRYIKTQVGVLRRSRLIAFSKCTDQELAAEGIALKGLEVARNIRAQGAK